MPTVEAMEGLTAHRLLPSGRNSVPEWEVSRGGQIIGHVYEVRIPHAIRRFYQAVGVNPLTGEPVNLELHTDFENRLQAIVRLQDDPEATRGIHWR